MFARQWLRAVLRAGGVVLVVPAGLVLAAALAVAVGGTSLDGLGQVLEGPQVPRGAAVSGASDGERVAELGLPRALPQQQDQATPRRTTSAPRRLPRAADGRPPQPGSTRPGPQTATTPRPRPTPAPGPDRSSAPVPAAPAPGPAPAAPAAPAPATPQGVRKLLDDTLRPLAPPVADAVRSITDLLAPPL